MYIFSLFGNLLWRHHSYLSFSPFCSLWWQAQKRVYIVCKGTVFTDTEVRLQRSLVTCLKRLEEEIYWDGRRWCICVEIKRKWNPTLCLQNLDFKTTKALFGKNINMTFNFLDLEQAFLMCCDWGHQPSNLDSVYQALPSNFFGYKAKNLSACFLPVSFLTGQRFSWIVLTWETWLLVQCLL